MEETTSEGVEVEKVQESVVEKPIETPNVSPE